jgi:hypothetical protein
MQIHSRKKRFAQQRADAMTAANQLMKRIVEHTVEPYEGYLQICGIFQRHAHLQMPELRDFVRIDGIDPNWSVSVTPELRHTIIQRAETFLATRREVPRELSQPPSDGPRKMHRT